MSRASRRDKRLRSRLEKDGVIPVQGNMIDRMTSLVKRAGGHVSNNGNGNSIHSHTWEWEKDNNGTWHLRDREKDNINNNINKVGGFVPNQNYLHPNGNNNNNNHNYNNNNNNNNNIKDVGYRKFESDTTTFTNKDIVDKYGKGQVGLSACNSNDIEASCPIANTPEIYMDKGMYNTWIDLAGNNDTEWLAYLIGEYKPGVLMQNGETSKGKWIIKNCYFPPQIANGAHVDVDPDYQVKTGTIGAVHSHVNMAVFFSGEDMKHSNWNVEIVINAKAEYKVMVRHKLDCGKFAKSYSKVWLTSLPSRESVELDKAFEKGEMLRQARLNKVNKGSKNTIVGDKPASLPIIVQGEIAEPMGDDPTRAIINKPVDNNVTNNNVTSGISIDEKTGQVMENGQVVGIVDNSGVVSTSGNVDNNSLQAAVDNLIDSDFPDCQKCNGKGWVDNIECPECKGQGWTRAVNETIVDDGSMMWGWN